MKHPNRDDVTDLDILMSVFDEGVSKLTDVHKTGAIRPEFYEDPEVCDSDDQGREHGARFETVHRWHVASQRHWVLELATVGERKLQCFGDGQ
jgi:hypothetical protein